MNDKELVAQAAAADVKDGMMIGLGTGSTANFFIEALAERCKTNGLRITAVASSVVSTIKAREAGLPLVSMEHIDHLDIYVDGADEVTPDFALLKGRGADLVREKLLAKAADRFVVLVDQSKLVSHIGEKYAIPIEVIPFAWQLAKRSIERLGGQGNLRRNSSGDGLAVTSHGSLVLDMSFDEKIDAKALNASLNATPGVVEHGIFWNLAESVLIARNGALEIRQNPG